MRWIPLALASALLASACSKPPQPQPAAKEAPQAAREDAKAAAPAEDAAPKPKPLSEEDKRLIAADPKDLTPEMRRKRAYALRRKAMQNPNSPLARTLNDLQKAYQDGEIDPNRKATPVFTVDGKPPTTGTHKGQGPAGARPESE
jgi:hypothetical protein